MSRISIRFIFILFACFIIVQSWERKTPVMTADEARECVAQNQVKAEMEKKEKEFEKTQNEIHEQEERLRTRQEILENVEEKITTYCAMNTMRTNVDLSGIMKMVKTSEVKRIVYSVDQPQVSFCVMDVLVEKGFYVEFYAKRNEMILHLDREKGSRIVVNEFSNRYGRTEWQIRCAGDYMPPNRVLQTDEKLQTLSDRNACALFQLEIIRCFGDNCFNSEWYENVKVINFIGDQGVRIMY